VENMKGVETMLINVYNNNNLVFTGTLDKFLSDNQEDEFLITECQKLNNSNVIEFKHFHSGDWKAELITVYKV
jgi:hypothetical protein